MRRHGIHALLLSIALAAGAYYLYTSIRPGGPGDAVAGRYNVVLVVSDSMRRDYLGCYGGEARTPNIDWLARNGVLFLDAYSNAPWTAPSAVTLFTGNYATIYPREPYERTLRFFVPDEELLLAEVLRRRGYGTPMLVENVQATLHNCLQGFSPLKVPADVERSVSPETIEAIELIMGKKRVRSPAYGSSFAVSRRILESPPGKNFFLVYWILDPHEPYEPPPRFKARIEVDRSKLARHERFYSSRKNLEGDLDDEEKRYIRSLYIAEIESVDERIGFLLAALSKRGIMDSTYVILTSDHGERFGERGRYGHGAFGENADFSGAIVRVPLVMMGPDLPRGKRIADRVSHVDLMPTLKELLGIEYEDGMQGKSLIPIVRGEPGAERTVYMADVQGEGLVDALVQGRYKLIARAGGALELYDIAGDPSETRDLSSSRPDLVASMLPVLKRTRETNAKRLAVNVDLVGEKRKPLAEEDREELLEKLRALGYVE